MRTHGLFHWTIGIATSMICILVTIAPVSAKSKVNDQNVTAVSGREVVTVKHIHQQVNVTEGGKPWSRATR